MKQVIIDSIKYNKVPFRLMMGCLIISFASLYLSITCSYYFFLLFFPALVIAGLVFSGLKDDFNERHKKSLDEKKQKEDWEKMPSEDQQREIEKNELEHSLLLERLRKDRIAKWEGERTFSQWEDEQKQKNKTQTEGLEETLIRIRGNSDKKKFTLIGLEQTHIVDDCSEDYNYIENDVDLMSHFFNLSFESENGEVLFIGCHVYRIFRNIDGWVELDPNEHHLFSTNSLNSLIPVAKTYESINSTEDLFEIIDEIISIDETESMDVNWKLDGEVGKDFYI